MRKEQKQKVVNNLKDVLGKIDAAVLIDYRGLNCEQMGKLRRELKAGSAELKVVKNTLLKLASKDTSYEKLESLFQGPTAITLIEDDPVEAARVLMKYVKEFKVLGIKGGVLQGNFIDSEAVKALSKLPSRDVLLSMLLSVLTGPMRGFATALSGVPRGFVTVLSALKEQKENAN